MAQQDVVQFVHDQHQEFFGRGGPGIDEVRIDQQSRLETALHGRGFHVAGLHDVQQAQQRAEGIGAAGEAVEDSVGQRRGVRFPKGSWQVPLGWNQHDHATTGLDSREVRLLVAEIDVARGLGQDRDHGKQVLADLVARQTTVGDDRGRRERQRKCVGVDPLPQLPVGFWVDLRRRLRFVFRGHTVQEGEDSSRVQAPLEIR